VCSKLEEKAVEYGRHGFKVIPLQPDRKEPLIENWEIEASGREENNFTFTNESGEFVKPASLRSFLNSKLKEAGLKKIRFHDLRHTCASLLLSRGADPQAISNMLAHSRVSTTMDVYGHLMPANKKEIGNTMDALLS
jgi:integrase